MMWVGTAECSSAACPAAWLWFRLLGSDMLLILSYYIMEIRWIVGKVLMWLSMSRTPLWLTCCSWTCTALKRRWEGSWTRLWKRWGWRKSSLSSTPRGQVQGGTLYCTQALWVCVSLALIPHECFPSWHPEFITYWQTVLIIQVCGSSTSPTTGPGCLCCAQTRSLSKRWRTTRCSCRTSCRPSTSLTFWMKCHRGRASCLWPIPSSPSGSRCSERGPTWKVSSLAQRISAHSCQRWHTEQIGSRTHSLLQLYRYTSLTGSYACRP